MQSTSFSGLFEISHDSTATGVPSDCNKETAHTITYCSVTRKNPCLPFCSPYSSSIEM